MKEQRNRIAQEMLRNHVNTDFEFVTINKNGKPFSGIRLDRGVISPVVYYDSDDSIDDIMERIGYALEQDNPEFDMNVLHDPNYILTHAYIGIQKKSNEDIIKEDCLNLEAYLKLQVDLGSDKGSLKICSSLLSMNDLFEEEAWVWAIQNTFNQFKISSMEEILGMPPGMIAAPFDIVTMTDGTDGAAALMFPEFFWKYCHERELTECLILPSSREELLIVKDGMMTDSGKDYQDLARMIKDINYSCVSSAISLPPVVFKYDLLANEITIVASADEVESGVA